MKLVAASRAFAGRVLGTVPGRVVRKLIEDNGPSQAVVIAWNFLFALFPILLAAVAILGFVLSRAGLTSAAIYSAVLDVIPQDAASRAQTVGALEAIKQQSGLLLVVGLAGLLWSGSSLFGAMEQAFDLIFHVQPRNFFRTRLMGFGMMLLFTVLAGLAAGTTALLPLLGQIPGSPDWVTRSATVYVLQPVLGIAAGILLFGCIYYVVPNRRQRIGTVWPGALLAGSAFYALTLVFPLYLSLNKGLSQYGSSFAFLFVLMNFFYFLGLITMLGVELNAVLYEVPVVQPGKAVLLAPAQSGRAGEAEVIAATAAEPAYSRDRARTAGAVPRGKRVPASPAPASDSPPRTPPQAGQRRGLVGRLFFGGLAAAIGLFAISRSRRVA